MATTPKPISGHRYWPWLSLPIKCFLVTKAQLRPGDAEGGRHCRAAGSPGLLVDNAGREHRYFGWFQGSIIRQALGSSGVIASDEVGPRGCAPSYRAFVGILEHSQLATWEGTGKG